MKKAVLQIAVLFALLPAIILSAAANSGPTYWPAAPGFELAVDTGCPITVLHEELVFDFNTEEPQDGWSPAADVTASYSMHNPSDEHLSVTMAFPFICSMSDMTNAVRTVTVNGDSFPFSTYFGNSVSLSDLPELELEDILSNVLTNWPEEPADGIIYTFTPVISGGYSGPEDIYAEISFASGMPCFFSNSMSYSMLDDGSAVLGTYFRTDGSAYSDGLLRVFVSGGSIDDYSTAFYSDPSRETETDGISFTVTSTPSSFRAFLEQVVSEYDNYFSAAAEIDNSSYGALLSEIAAGTYGGYFNYIPVFDMWNSFSHQDRQAMAVYTVDFAPNETKEISVTCGLQGVMNRPDGYRSDGTSYTYTYLSNPAKNWAGFGTLSINVLLPEGFSFPIASSVPELTETSPGVFSAQLDGLPDENITFILGDINHEITPDTKAPSPALWISGTVFLILIATGTVLCLKRKKASSR